MEKKPLLCDVLRTQAEEARANKLENRFKEFAEVLLQCAEDGNFWYIVCPANPADRRAKMTYLFEEFLTGEGAKRIQDEGLKIEQHDDGRGVVWNCIAW